ncbi:MAG: tail fiber protein [Candidatus Sulfotelmatobacter sp.]
MASQFLGEIRMFAGNFAPQGWAMCNGQLLSISQNTALFALLGTTYGGDGTTTFALPNLQSRIPIHQGQGVGLSPYVIGQLSGTENVTLLTSQLPQHTHAANADSGSGGVSNPANTYWASSANTKQYAPSTNAAMAPSAMSQTGGSQPHTNIMPYLAVSFIIALEGIFPSRN